MRFYPFCILIFMSMFFPLIAHAQDKLIIKHYQFHERYSFGLRVLELALGKLDLSYDIQTPNTQEVNEKRGETQIIAGRLDVEWMSTTREREAKMIPIKVPLYRGLLGLRLVLVTPKVDKVFSRITSIKELRGFVGGHGTYWGDLPVYAANDLRVETSALYDTLFVKLIGGRFDYFHRGLNEIWEEQEKYSGQLRIADNVMLFYPHPVYFFVGRHKPELAEKLEEGLQIAIRDGSYRTLFQEVFGDNIRDGNLDNRRLIVLKNPVVPQDAPAIDTSWWMPKPYRSQMLSN